MSWIKVHDIAVKYGVDPTLLNYHVRQQGIPTQKLKGANHVKECDLERVKLCIAKYRWLKERKENVHLMEKQQLLRRRVYENKKRKRAGLPPLERLNVYNDPLVDQDIFDVQPADQPFEVQSKAKKKLEPLSVVFEYKDRIKRGHIIGGRVKDGYSVIVLIKFTDSNGFHSIADVKLEAIRHDHDEVLEHIGLVHKTRTE